MNVSMNRSSVAESANFRLLTDEEIEFVSGGNPLGGVVGAVAGGAGYLGGAAVSGEFSWIEFGGAVATGGLAGATMGVTAFGAYAVPRIMFVGGAVTAMLTDS